MYPLDFYQISFYLPFSLSLKVTSSGKFLDLYISWKVGVFPCLSYKWKGFFVVVVCFGIVSICSPGWPGHGIFWFYPSACSEIAHYCTCLSNHSNNTLCSIVIACVIFFCSLISLPSKLLSFTKAYMLVLYFKYLVAMPSNTIVQGTVWKCYELFTCLFLV